MTGRAELLALAAAAGHEPIDLSLGVAPDPPPAVAAEAAHGYPPSAGTPGLVAAAAGYLRRRFGVTLPSGALAACVGSKEFIATAALFLRESVARDVVLVPALGYPAYAHGARLAGCRPVRVPADAGHRLRPDRLPPEVVARALCLWVNSPANPTGAVEPLGELADWGRARGVVVLSDEAYAETTWAHEPRSVLQHGTDGVLAVHSVSKRSNAPGLRVGFYAGDPALVAELVPRRRSAGLLAAAASQAAAALLLADDRHADEQRERTRRRLADLVALLAGAGVPCAPAEGGPFLWVAAPGGDGAAFARRLAATCGVVVMPGGEYGPTGAGHVRIAAVRDAADLAPRIGLLAAVTGTPW